MEHSLPPSQTATEEAMDPDEITVAVDDTAQPVARPAAPIVALSEDPALVDAMAAAALDVATIIVSPSADRFVDQLVASACEMALIDAASAPPGLAEFVQLLHRQFPQLQLLVAAPGNVQHQIAPQIADGTVFRFVHKPASAQRLRLFVDAALRARQTRITEAILNTPLTAQERASATPSRAAPMRGLLLAGAVLTLCLVGVALWRHSLQSAPRAAATSTSTATAIQAPPSPAALAAQAAAEQEAIDRAAAERSDQSERERLAAENDARQAAVAEQARRAAIDARNQLLRADAEPLVQIDATQLQLDPLTVEREAARAAELAQVSLPETTEAPEPPAVRAQPSAPQPGAPPLGADTVEESTLHRVNFIAPLYPMGALIHKVSGTIEMDFTVTPQGGVSDIVVTSADPVGVFERASTAALSRSHYEPVIRDGVPVAQRAHLRLRFTP